MKPVTAVIAPGAMGSAIARRLVEHGLDVLTSLHGRSSASMNRARSAGMCAVDEAALGEADVLLSIVPPGQALGLARQLADILSTGKHRPIYVDCNAISPQNTIRIGEIVTAAGMRFVDAGIIGGPPKPGMPSPVIYASGLDAAELHILAECGLTLKVLDAPIGAASGLKMSYAGITKGTTALASAMILAATHFGVDADLRKELAASQPHLLTMFQRSVPDMYPKAYRWVAEMEEIADFAGEDAAVQAVYRGIAQLYQALANDYDGGKTLTNELSMFFGT